MTASRLDDRTVDDATIRANDQADGDPGNVDVLLAKFEAAAEIQRDNAGCEVMIAAKSSIEASVVYLFEVWSSEEEWNAARSTPAIAEWARDMPLLVSAPAESTRLDSAIGKGLSRPDRRLAR